MTDSRDQELQRRIAATLDAGCLRLDATTQQRLDRARAQALDQASRRAWRLRWAAPALATACLVLIAVVVAVAVRSTPGPESPPMTADLDIVTDPRFELILEDPEFVAWLAESESREHKSETLPENSG